MDHAILSPDRFQVSRMWGTENAGRVFRETRQTHLTPMQVVLLMRGICKGESSKVLAAELKLSYVTVLSLRHLAQANAEQAQPETPLPDQRTETDEMFQNAGEKR